MHSPAWSSMVPATPSAPGPAAVRVMTVDDHERFLSLAHDVIEATQGFEAVGEAASGLAGVEMAAALRPDIVLMDVRMPGLNGIEAARRIVGAGTARVLVLLSCDPFEVPPDLAGTTALRKEHLRPETLRRVWQRSAQPATAASS